MRNRRPAPHPFRLAWLLALIMLGSWSAPGAAADIQARLEDFRRETGTPGVVLAVMRQGQATPQVYASGLANAELGVPASRETVFRVGSVTKVFTAVAIMKLVEEGRLSLDTTMQDFFPQLPSAGSITVRQMLQHSSGLPEYLTLEPFTSNMAQPYTPQQLLDMVAKAPLDFPPGSRFRYSNSGYLVLGMLVEKVAGQDFSSFLASQVTGPLGMASTRLYNDQELVPQRASGCDIQSIDGRPTLVNAPWVSIVPPCFAGGLMSQPADFVRLVNLHKVLKPATIALMQQPGTAPDGGGPRLPLGPEGPTAAIDYGLGFELVRLGDDPRILVTKDGSIPGFSSWYVLAPEKGLALAASANNEKALQPLLLMMSQIMAQL